MSLLRLSVGFKICTIETFLYLGMPKYGAKWSVPELAMISSQLSTDAVHLLSQMEQSQLLAPAASFLHTSEYCSVYDAVHAMGQGTSR